MIGDKVMFDFIIVGAGIAGIVASEEIANLLNKKVLLIDKNNHIGGNCYDYVNNEGTIVHKYGAHIFHTDSSRVYNYLSLFTIWNMYNHKVLYKIEDKLVPVPFNLISIDKCLPDDSERIKNVLLDEYEANTKVSVNTLLRSDRLELKKLGTYIKDNVFANEIKKQYGINDDQLDQFTNKMLPLQVSYDCRYYQDIYQAVPTHGYTKMFENMLSNHNITVMLNKDYHEILSIDYENKKIYYEGEEFNGHLIFTGRIDEFFDYKYGELPYRSIVFLNENISQMRFQDNATINYPENPNFTRITEMKFLTGQQTFNTTIQFEFPVEYDKNNLEQNIPYYPIDTKENQEIYRKYEKLSEEFDNVTFTGRLTKFKDMSMDKIVEEVLDLVNDKFIGV